ncbi:MAG: NAD(P)/FAD-dependent oxidoreductase [Clostridiaceae bacterium]|nr:NAD(P)/FAD-dependent oxidoreductase [Clostridiaceae bacterium]
MIRVPDIKIDIEENKEAIKLQILKKLRIKPEDLLDYTIYKEAIDARKKDKVYFVYTVDVEVRNENSVLQRSRDKKIALTPDLSYKSPQSVGKTQNPPVIIGTGPAGIFAGLVLAQMGYNPILLERGKDVDERTKDINEFWRSGKLNTESNVQFGEGGAGTFSDGKLTTQIKDVRCRKVLMELVEAGAPQEIIYKSKPHIGTDILRDVVKNIRQQILSLGGEVRFQSKVTDILINNGEVKGVVVNNEETIETENVILAIGHSARDTFEMLHENAVEIHQKPFSIGVRIEHPQSMIDASQYGTFAGHPRLGAADYKMAYHCKNKRSAYTFCMCPGGQVVAAASEEGRLVTNGMSEYARDKENANSALLVGIDIEDFESEHPLAGMYFQRKWEEKAFEVGGGDYKAPAQLVKDFLEDRPSENLGMVKPSYTPGVVLTDLRKCLPDYVVATMKEGIIGLDRKLHGFNLGDAVMTGVETRSSSPIRIKRDGDCISNIRGLHPAGEGAGYAGGIISAAVDGIKVAEAIVKLK